MWTAGPVQGHPGEGHPHHHTVHTGHAARGTYPGGHQRHGGREMYVPGRAGGGGGGGGEPGGGDR